MDSARERLITWTGAADEMAPQWEGKEQWFKGEHFQYLPTKPELRAAGYSPILFGWKPEQPIIGPSTRVLAIGSCFAEHFILWLGDHGFNRAVPDSPYNALIKFGFGFESAAVIAQQFRWAYDRLDPQDTFWFGRDRRRVYPTEEGRLLAREALEQTDVLIITLGLSEVWYDRATGEPLWRAVPVHSYDPSRHAFKVLGVPETVAALEEIDSIRRAHLPGLKILYTVSPVRLHATYRPISAVTANCASKAILRAALDEFLRAHWDEINRTYFYFPAYEIVTDLIPDPFLADMRHLYPHVPRHVLSLFAEHYTSFPPDGTAADGESDEAGLYHIIAELEHKVQELQHVCDDRLAVIKELDRAARERLALIERLDAELHRPPATPEKPAQQDLD
jgi:hypothetical protein